MVGGQVGAGANSTRRATSDANVGAVAGSVLLRGTEAVDDRNSCVLRQCFDLCAAV